MEINSPTELLQAINNLLLQMNRPQRKQFLAWVKAKRNAYDFNYPEGYLPKGDENVQETTATAEPVVAVPESDVPKLLVPEPGIIVPSSSK